MEDSVEVVNNFFNLESPEILSIIEEIRHRSKIGHYFYWIRREKKLTEKEFAESLKISMKSLRNIEEADYHKPDLEKIYEKAKKLYGELTRNPRRN